MNHSFTSNFSKNKLQLHKTHDYMTGTLIGPLTAGRENDYANNINDITILSIFFHT